MVRGAADKEANNIQARLPVVRKMENLSDAAQRKGKQKWAIEKPKLDNARRLRGIYFIDPADAGFTETILKKRGESWKFRCEQLCLARSGVARTSRPIALLVLATTKYACIVEAGESTRKRLERTPHKDHEDHIVGKGTNSLNHCNLVQKLIPMP